jgi:hypothetical protein
MWCVGLGLNDFPASAGFRLLGGEFAKMLPVKHTGEILNACAENEDNGDSDECGDHIVLGKFRRGFATDGNASPAFLCHQKIMN